ncbi:unnamed protein product [Candidula unifasciata]|uniref:ShKT domain-containing protein n=1 Tax=Candidula unifasciata TaxID=100452 RepID=A0A8S4A5E3_9EUPU|nr:unnamed protein product [Candidula unifasciata]
MPGNIQVSLLLLAVFLLRHLASSCSFPSTLHMEAKDPPWYSHIRADGSRDVEYYIRNTVMEIHHTRSERPSVRWKCAYEFEGKLLLKRQDQLVNSFYRCVRFVFRSPSVVQIMWSHELKIFDLGLCDDKNLITDPWPLIWYGTLEEDYTPCPFSGGFDMKISDSQLGENGCNLMLRPMRMEAECLGGEGISFNFVSSNCLPDIRMYVKQRTICVAHWKDNRHLFVVLRRNEDTDLWCLIMPIHRRQNITAYLFSDLTCRSDLDQFSSVRDLKFFDLQLHRREFPTLCEDEYDQCSKVTCNTYVKQECQRSCGMCDPVSPRSSCQYPESVMGAWFLQDSSGFKNIYIRTSNLSIDGVGNFLCVTFPNNPIQKSTIFTTISLFQNGCRPRYTCIKLHRIGPSVLQYSLSQSYVWPTFENDLGKSICSEDRFHPDSSPIDDRYRSHQGTGKPIISQRRYPDAVHCNLTFVHTISATLPQGYVCPGSFYQHCEDSSKVRLEFNTCGSLIPSSRDFRCLASYEGHYWERILILQNIRNRTDAFCFVYSQFYPIEAYVLDVGMCDQKSFNFARTGLRQPLLKLTFRTEQETCKSVPPDPTLLLTEVTEYAGGEFDSTGDEDGHDNVHANNSQAESDSEHSVSVVSGSRLVKLEHTPQNDHLSSFRDSLEMANAKSTSLDHRDSFRADDTHSSKTETLASPWILLLVITSVLF